MLPQGDDAVNGAGAGLPGSAKALKAMVVLGIAPIRSKLAKFVERDELNRLLSDEDPLPLINTVPGAPKSLWAGNGSFAPHSSWAKTAS